MYNSQWLSVARWKNKIVLIFLAFVEENATEFNTVFRKSCISFCAKPKEVNPIKLNFTMTNKYFDSTQTYN